MPVSRSGVSGSSSVVVPQESTEPFTAFDVASRVADIISGIDQQDMRNQRHKICLPAGLGRLVDTRACCRAVRHKSNALLHSQLNNVETADDADRLIVSDHHDVMNMAIHHIGCDHCEFRLGRALHDVALHKITHPECLLRLT